MMPSLLLAATLMAPGAPIPKDTAPTPSGPAPRILAVKANESGTVMIFATVMVKRKIMAQVVVVENGKQVVKQQEQEITTQTYINKNIEDFGGKFTAADGTVITADQASRKVRDGATILITADGKPIDPAWLRAVARDTVVMITDELAEANFQFGQASLPTTQAPRLVMLGTDDKGNVRLPVNPNPVAAGGGGYYDEFNGFQNARIVRARMVNVNGNIVQVTETETADAGTNKPASTDGKKALEDIRFEAYDLTGKQIPKAEAVKKLKAGGMVLFAGDCRFPDPEYLKPFNEDLMVLVSPELIFAPGQPNPYDTAAKKVQAPAAKAAAAAPAPAAVAVPARALPAVAPVAVPVQAMKIQIAPAAVLPAAPPTPKEKAAEKPAEKPAEKKVDKPAAPAVKP
jgi:hypothetical protein